MKKKLFIFFGMICFEPVVCQDNGFNKWSIEASIGQNKAVKPFATGYYSSDPATYFNFDIANHYDLGVRYMLSPKFGLKLDFANDKFKNQSGSGSFSFNVQQYRIGFQGIANVGKILEFQSFTNKIGLIGHAGFQVSRLTPKMGFNKNVSEDNGGIIVGLTPQFKISKSLAIMADFSAINNVRQHYNWDGSLSDTSNNLSGLVFTTSLGITLYMGSNENHADWYEDTVKKEILNTISNSEKDNKGLNELKEKFASIEKMINDSDNDGVPDYKDLQKDTPHATVVDSDGRFIDVNKDGIPDKFEVSTLDNGAFKSIASREIAEKMLFDNGFVNIFFDKDQEKPNTISTNSITNLIHFLRKYPDVKVILTGYADFRGGIELNKALSQRRAQNVRKILIFSGIDQSRMKVVGAGVDKSFMSNSKITMDISRRVTVTIE